MNDIDALLAGDLSDPATRLVLADALEEAGRMEEANMAASMGHKITIRGGEVWCFTGWNYYRLAINPHDAARR